MHNTLGCHKYGRDGNVKGGDNKKGNSNKKGKELGQNYAQLMSKLMKLKKKLSHASVGKKWKCDHYESDSSSNSE